MYNRLSTKEDRLNSQKVQFEYLLKNGYTQEVYKGLNIFINDLTMKIFKDTSSNHILFIKYRTPERMEQAKQEAKNGYDRQQAYKEEAKKNKRVSSHAACAAAIKEELTALYPHIKFSVKSSSFSMGDSVDVSYTDGPTTAEIDAIISKYQYGHFNGMEDMYENTNSRDDIPQSKYVSAHRQMSTEVEEAIKEDAEKIFNADHYASIHTTEQFIYRVFYHTSIPAGAIVTGIERTAATSGINTPETFYTLSFKVEEETTPEPLPVKPGNVQIIDYSEKAIAVIGDFSKLYDKLISIGGRYNSRLSCGKGIIFSKKRLEEVKQALQPDTLKDEVKKTIEFLAETDKKIYGQITEVTKEAAKVQKVSIDEPETYNSLQDIEEAANGGKVISLFNLCELVNQK